MGILQRRFVRVAARSVTAAAVSLAVLGAVTSAQASVIFDFAAMAAGNEGEFSSATVMGIKVTATASGVAASRPYLDDVFQTRPAGLGVCSGFDGEDPPQCDPSSDDNVGLVGNVGPNSETLTLSFSDAMTMDPLIVVLFPTFFRDDLHFNEFGMNDEIFIDDGSGGGFMTFALPGIGMNGQFSTTVTGSTISFKFNNAAFYIEKIEVSPVPLPAALPLFLSALAGLALLGRRQRKKAAA